MRLQTQERQRLNRLSVICITAVLLPVLIIIVYAQFLLSEPLAMGWVLALVGVALLATSTTRNLVLALDGQAQKMIGTEYDMGLIGMGLGMVAPTPLLSYYFFGIAGLSVAFFVAKIVRAKN